MKEHIALQHDQNMEVSKPKVNSLLCSAQKIFRGRNIVKIG